MMTLISLISVLQGLPVYTDPMAPTLLAISALVIVSSEPSALKNPLSLVQSFGPAVFASQSDEYNIKGDYHSVHSYSLTILSTKMSRLDKKKGTYMSRGQ